MESIKLAFNMRFAWTLPNKCQTKWKKRKNWTRERIVAFCRLSVAFLYRVHVNNKTIACQVWLLELSTHPSPVRNMPINFKRIRNHSAGMKLQQTELTLTSFHFHFFLRSFIDTHTHTHTAHAIALPSIYTKTFDGLERVYEFCGGFSMRPMQLEKVYWKTWNFVRESRNHSGSSSSKQQQQLFKYASTVDGSKGIKHMHTHKRRRIQRSTDRSIRSFSLCRTSYTRLESFGIAGASGEIDENRRATFLALSLSLAPGSFFRVRE